MRLSKILTILLLFLINNLIYGQESIHHYKVDKLTEVKNTKFEIQSGKPNNLYVDFEYKNRLLTKIIMTSEYKKVTVSIVGIKKGDSYNYSETEKNNVVFRLFDGNDIETNDKVRVIIGYKNNTPIILNSIYDMFSQYFEISDK